MKTCLSCRQTLAFENFYAKQSRCKPCTREAVAAYKKANAVKVNACNSQWRRKNLEASNDCTRRWRNKNWDRFNEIAATRRAARKSTLWANASVIRDLYTYARLMREAGIDAHVDHIVPLCSPLVCGLHVEANLTVLPADKNRAKGNRFWPDMP